MIILKVSEKYNNAFSEVKKNFCAVIYSKILCTKRKSLVSGLSLKF